MAPTLVPARPHAPRPQPNPQPPTHPPAYPPTGPPTHPPARPQAQWEQALSTLDTLQRQGLSPETRTFNVVMAACNAAGKHAQTLSVFSALLASGRAPSTASLNSAITAHCRWARPAVGRVAWPLVAWPLPGRMRAHACAWLGMRARG